jgi:hypothetical protein
MENCNTHVLLTGDLRFKDSKHFNEFVESTHGCKIYISTYTKYANLAKELSDKYFILDESHREPAYNMYQWKHLDLLINEYCSDFVKTDNVFKIRTDSIFTKHIFEENNSNDYFKIETDQVFSAKAHLFTYALKNFYPSIEKYYWNEDGMLDTFDLNYENLILSENRDEQCDSAFKWHWFVYSKKILSHENITFSQFKENLKNNLLLDATDKKYHGIMPIWMPRVMEQSKFSTEKMFLYHLLEHCPVRNYSTQILLHEDRFSFSYNI